MFTKLLNFRDLATADPVRIRPGRLYRSDTLTRMDDADWERLAPLGVRTVVDLRTPEEIQGYGRVRLDSGIRHHNLSIQKTEWPAYAPEAGIARFLADRYLTLAEEGRAELATALTLLARPESAPAVMHCASGRDRAGTLAALTLALLGVDDDRIAADYARSGDAAERTAALLSEQHGRPFVHAPEYAETPAEATLLFLAGLRGRHGSIDAYVRSIGVRDGDIHALREHMLS